MGISYELLRTNFWSNRFSYLRADINFLKTYTYENVTFNVTLSNCKYIKKKCKYQYIYYDIIVNMVIIVNVNRNKLNVNGSKCKCTCNIVIFKELKLCIINFCSHWDEIDNIR